MNNEFEVAVEEAARLYGVSTTDVLRPGRREPMSTARQLVLYVIRKRGASSLPEIAKVFDVTHATVIHSVRQVETRLQTDAELRTSCEKLVKAYDEKVKSEPLSLRGSELLNLQYGSGGCVLRVLGDHDAVRLKVMTSEKEVVLEILPALKEKEGELNEMA